MFYGGLRRGVGRRLRSSVLGRIEKPGEGQGKRLRTFELQDVESSVVVGEVHHALRIDEAVGGLDDLRPVGTRVEHALGIGRASCRERVFSSV